MRAVLLTVLAGCGVADPCGASPLDERCAGDLQLELVEDGLEFRVAESLVDPDRLEVARLIACDDDLGDARFDTDLWDVRDLGSALVLEGLVYGVVPEGATERAPPEALIDGETYTVHVGRGSVSSPLWTLWFVPDLGRVEHVTTFCPSWWPVP